MGNKMHVLVAAVSRATAPTGVCRHAANLSRALCAANVRVTLLAGAWQEKYFREAFSLEGTGVEVVPVRLFNTSLGRNWFYAVTMMRMLRQWKPDILHLGFPAPVALRRPSGTKIVVSLHDLYALDAPEVFGRRASGNKLTTLWGLKACDAIAAVSQTALRRLETNYPVLAEKAWVVPNAVPWVESNHLGSVVPTSRSYLLCVAQHRAHKRLDALLRAFAELRRRVAIRDDAQLTIVGEHGPETERLRALERQLLPFGSVNWKRGLSDSELNALYRGALALVTASRIEGFGLPVAEARAVGCRVVCSRISAHLEVAGEGVTYFSEDANEHEIADAIEFSLQKEKVLPQRMGSSVREVAARYVELYDALGPYVERRESRRSTGGAHDQPPG